MKNLGFMAIATFALTCSTLRADVVDFDELPLAADSAWVGPDPNGVITNEIDSWGTPYELNTGSFASDGAVFTNRYNLTFSVWSSFAYSNRTDTTTGDFSNQTSAITGRGFNSTSGPSDNYAVGFGYTDLPIQSATAADDLSNFALPQSQKIVGAYFTNATYSALVIENGNSFARKFGHISDGDLNNPGWINTQEPDWFKLTIYGVDENGDLLSNNVEFYLADFRAPDDNDDYVIDEWTYVDLTPLAEARTLFFNLTSSDNDVNFGMNTPGYFAIDNIVIQPVPEPTTAALFCIAAAGLGLRRRAWSAVSRRRRK